MHYFYTLNSNFNKKAKHKALSLKLINKCKFFILMYYFIRNSPTESLSFTISATISPSASGIRFTTTEPSSLLYLPLKTL